MHFSCKLPGYTYHPVFYSGHLNSRSSIRPDSCRFSKQILSAAPRFHVSPKHEGQYRTIQFRSHSVTLLASNAQRRFVEGPARNVRFRRWTAVAYAAMPPFPRAPPIFSLAYSLDLEISPEEMSVVLGTPNNRPRRWRWCSTCHNRYTRKP